jgi:mannan endo-1,4-beta-mannosidase
MKAYFLLPIFIAAILFSSCKKKQKEIIVEPTPAIVLDPVDFTKPYSIVDNKIYNYASPVQLLGANGLHTYAASSGNDMKNWHIDIVREFVSNMKEQPITGYPIQDGVGAWLHSLQAVVDSNRINNKITILCPFRWNGNTNTDFTGKMPSQTYWYADCKTKLAQWATHFINQPDVWIELWNEPYRYDRADGYTDDIWMNEMNDLTAAIRNTGNKNIVLVPCAEQGQDESVLINKGVAFLANKRNILFDIHAYEKWLQVPNSNMGSRLQQLKQNKLPIIFGEVAPMNASVLMNPKPFLDTVYSRGLSCMAWVWKYDGTDTDALLTASGLPNDNNNNNWGTTYKTFCLKVRNP